MPYTLVLDDKDMAALNLAIGELPHRIAAPLIAKINAQLAEEGSHADQSRGSRIEDGS